MQIIETIRKPVLELKVGDIVVESWHRGKPTLRVITLPRTEVLSSFPSLENPRKTLKVIRQPSHLEGCSDWGMVHLSTSKGIWCLPREEIIECVP